MAFVIGNRTSVDAKAKAIAAAKAAAGKSESALIKYISPDKCTDRSRLVFDDSGSMYGQIKNAKAGVVEYLRNCIPNQTAVAIHFMNTKSWSTELSSNLIQVAKDVQEASLSDGGTPFFDTCKKALQATPVLTRLIAFTDGSPTDALTADSEESMQRFYDSSNWMASAAALIQIALAVGGGHKHIPIDTVFFGSSHSEREIALLKHLSDSTGGFFLRFDPSKPGIWKQMKYLAPVNRLQLTNGAFRARVERGE